MDEDIIKEDIIKKDEVYLRNYSNQIQQHFLYNVLASIQELVLEDPEYASDLIGDFATYLRSCMRAFNNDSPIPFNQELDNVRAYTNIEKMRLGKKLDVLFDIQTDDFLILPLCVQPIVENAIKHGIFEKGDQGGSVMITTFNNEDDVCIMVEDNGVGFNAESLKASIQNGESDSIGLKNVIYRLERIMHASVDINSCAGKGTAVTIAIPKEFKGNESNHSR